MNNTMSKFIKEHNKGKLNRREFLFRVGGTAALTSLLQLLPSRPAFAQMRPSVYTMKERDRRWTNIRKMMSDQGFDCLVIPHSPEMGYSHLGFANYLTNDTFSNRHPGAVIFPLKDKPTIIGLTPPASNAPKGWVNNYTSKWSAAGQLSIADHIINKLNENGFAKANIGVIGTKANVEGANEFSNEGFISYAVWSAVLAALPNATFIDITAQFAELISIKGEEEIVQFEKAAMIGEGLHQLMLDKTKIGMSDKKFRAIVAEYLIMNNARADIQALFLAPGNIHDGQVINSEYGIVFSGGYAQVTLCMAVGKVSKLTEELAKVAHESLEYGKKNLKPGARFGDVIQGMEDIVLGNGYWHGFPQIHSLRPMFMVGPVYSDPPPSYPSKTLGADIIIKEGMILSFEPGAKMGNSMAAPEVKVGATCVITKSGPRLFNKIGQRMRYV